MFLSPFLQSRYNRDIRRYCRSYTESFVLLQILFYDLVLMRLIIELAIKMAREGMRYEGIADFIEGSSIIISN